MTTRFQTLLLVLILSLLTVPDVAIAATSDELKNSVQTAKLEFGKTITFRLEVEWHGRPPTQFTLLFGYPNTNLRLFASVQPDIDGTQVTANHTWDIDQALVPGVDIEYHWRLLTHRGVTLETQPSRILYEDSSLPWQQIKQGFVEIRWYEGDRQFGQRALDASNQALTKIHQHLDMQLHRPTRIVLYADRKLMHTALGGGTSPWVAGQTTGTLSTMVLHAPSSSQELGVLIAHELTHIVLDQFTQNPFSRPPAWIHEGLATYMESTIAPRFDYDHIVTEAIKNGTTPSLRGLLSTFPADDSRAILAYAHTNSLMRFVIEQYGYPALRQLLQTYRQGLTDDEALQRTFQVSISKLETSWLDHINRTTPPPTNTQLSATESSETPNTHKAFEDRLREFTTSKIPARNLAENGQLTPTSKLASHENVISLSTRLLGTTVTAAVSQIAPPPSLVRKVAMGSVVVIAILVGFVIWQFLTSKHPK